MPNPPVILVCMGCFDPITRAHSLLVEYAHDWLTREGRSITHILFSPAHDNYPHKCLAPSIHRIRMLRLAIAESKLSHIMDVDTAEAECTQGYQPTYVIAETLKQRYKDAEIYIVAGMDLLYSQCDERVWNPVNVKKLYSLVSAVIVPRDGGAGGVPQKKVIDRIKQLPYLDEPYRNGRILILNKSVSEISSTAAKEALRQRSETMCVDSVQQYILNNALYSAPSNLQ
ncbi:Nicotinamide-nucleotide adenylyltransferase [Giardia lamblia P15]|uniref:Nicotinamide-nucleotide adenylyltransferase n=1 Tax=Giardia intestinalis (strain P15) TaxID=658858 RepID=E1F8L5_GIAIA|nr:Nicotinamide-nucleotide adenylyltransferase [Giardia lamblia P15]